MSDPAPARVADWMSPDVQRVRADAPADAAHVRMRERGVHHLVVVEGGRVTGIVSARDIGGDDDDDQRRHRLVRDFMTAAVETIDAGASVAEAAGRLRNRELSSLVVTSGEEIVGILTVNDLLRLVEAGAAATPQGGTA